MNDNIATPEFYPSWEVCLGQGRTPSEIITAAAEALNSQGWRVVMDPEDLCLAWIGPTLPPTVAVRSVAAMRAVLNLELTFRSTDGSPVPAPDWLAEALFAGAELNLFFRDPWVEEFDDAFAVTEEVAGPQPEDIYDRVRQLAEEAGRPTGIALGDFIHDHLPGGEDESTPTPERAALPPNVVHLEDWIAEHPRTGSKVRRETL